MQEAFGTLIWVVAIGGAIVAIYTLIGTGRSYREIGDGGIGHDEDDRGESAPMSADAERDMEIRQLLEGRNARRARRGEAPQDVEEQFAALTRTDTDPTRPVDDELRDEIRQHVLARNARRVRAGAEPLDVEQEIARRISELS